MFAPDNSTVATVLLLGTMVCWGSWSSLRVLCRAEAPVFAIFYVSGQFIVGTMLGLSLGMVSTENSVFNRQTFLEGFTHPGDWYRVLAIFIGGMCCANSDFLAACACTRLPFAVVVPIFMGWSLMQATILNFIIEGDDDTNPLLLFLGVFAAFMAICSMALSDYCADDPSTEFSSRLSKHSVSGSEAATLDPNLLTKSLLSADIEGTEQAEDVKDDKSGPSPWIYVSVFSGFLAGLWSPLGTMGRTKGDYPVDNPSVALFIFQLGSLFSVPFMLLYYGRVIHVYETSPHKSPVQYSTYIEEAQKLPQADKFYGFLAGGIVSCGTYIFFTASQAISSTIAFAICSCAPLVTITIGVVIFRQLKNAPFWQSFFLIFSTFLFILAIALMVLANSL